MAAIRSSSSFSATGSSSQQRSFDFSALHESMTDIKRHLWEIDRRESSFKRHLHLQHTDFANKIILRKKEEALNSYSVKLEEERESMRAPSLRR